MLALNYKKIVHHYSADYIIDFVQFQQSEAICSLVEDKSVKILNRNTEKL